MAFLDNSGDIILDAVLTDTGRARLAKGDGTFRIAKFALGDDEIDYSLYDKNNASGSAYYDLEILQTPVLEAFTNNTSNLNSRLISISRTNLLYLPSIVLNTRFASNTENDSTTGLFYVSADSSTQSALTNAGTSGLINGADGTGGNYIRVDQGLNTSEVSPNRTLESDLVETQYIVEMDSRFGQLVQSTKPGNAASVSFIDDDQIASYYLSSGEDSGFVKDITENGTLDGSTGSGGSQMVIAGPRGTSLEFSILTSTDLNSSTFLFEQLGGTDTLDGVAVLFIDTNIRITGVTTGSRIDVPVRFVKKSS